VINLTEKGIEMGKYLLYRHSTIFEFLNLIGVNKNILEQTENIEHAIYNETLDKISKLIKFLRDNDFENGWNFC